MKHITGKHNVNEAIEAYFAKMKPFFKYNAKKRVLKLTQNFYSIDLSELKFPPLEGEIEGPRSIFNQEGIMLVNCKSNYLYVFNSCLLIKIMIMYIHTYVGVLSTMNVPSFASK